MFFKLLTFYALTLQHGAKLAVLGPMAFARDDMISDYGNGDWRHQNACWNGSPARASQSSDHCIPTIAEALAPKLTVISLRPRVI